MNIFKPEIILKDFSHFHKYNVGDRVIVHHGDVERVATIKKVTIHFSNGKPDKENKFYPTWLYYYFNEFDGWLEEKNILEVLNKSPQSY